MRQEDNGNLAICNVVKLSLKTGVMSFTACYTICDRGFDRIQKGDVARMAKLVVLAGATTRAR